MISACQFVADFVIRERVRSLSRIDMCISLNRAIHVSNNDRGPYVYFFFLIS